MSVMWLRSCTERARPNQRSTDDLRRHRAEWIAVRQHSAQRRTSISTGHHHHQYVGYRVAQNVRRDQIINKSVLNRIKACQ